MARIYIYIYKYISSRFIYSKISNPVIEKAVLVTKAVSYKSSPSGEDMSKLYCQIACFLQVNARTQFLSYKVFYSLKLNL